MDEQKAHNIALAKKIIVDSANELNVIPYAVGGYVRDMLLHNVPNDLDITTQHENSDELAYYIADKHQTEQPVVYDETGTVMLTLYGIKCEFSVDQHEKYIARELASRNLEPTTLNKDVIQRDFTINSLALNLFTDEILDITKQGVKDLLYRRKLRTTLTDPNFAISINPLIVFRGIRFMVEYNLQFVENLNKAFVANHDNVVRYIYENNKQNYVRTLIEKALVYGEKEVMDLLEQYDLIDGEWLPEGVHKKYKMRQLGVTQVVEAQTYMQQRVIDRKDRKQEYRKRKRRDSLKNKLKKMRTIQEILNPSGVFTTPKTYPQWPIKNPSYHEKNPLGG